VMDLPGAVVTKKPVEFSNRIGEIRISLAINNVDMLRSMRVVQPKTMFLLGRNGCNCATRGEQHDQQ